MTRERIALGKFGEDLALKKIRKMGYKKVTRNYRCRLGEIDLIARDGETLVFIEIKTRSAERLDYAKEAINTRKRHQLSKVALSYMKENNCCDCKSRFDVVAVAIGGERPQIEVIKNAFELDY